MFHKVLFVMKFLLLGRSGSYFTSRFHLAIFNSSPLSKPFLMTFFLYGFFLPSFSSFPPLHTIYRLYSIVFFKKWSNAVYIV